MSNLIPRRKKVLPERGRCDACGKEPRVLTKIESGQELCRTCLGRLRRPKTPDPNAPASDDLVDEARQFGVELPFGVSNKYATKLIGFARRRFAITDDLLTEDYTRLARLQDDVMCYVVDVWEEITGKKPRDCSVPWEDQQAFAAELVQRFRDMAHAIQHIQLQRQRRQHAMREEFATTHEGGDNLPWDAFRQPVAHDDLYERVVERLKMTWHAYLPRKRGLLSRLFGGN